MPAVGPSGSWARCSRMLVRCSSPNGWSTWPSSRSIWVELVVVRAKTQSTEGSAPGCRESDAGTSVAKTRAISFCLRHGEGAGTLRACARRCVFRYVPTWASGAPKLPKLAK
eukprot:7390567-Prymnesium_polylepis.1